MGTTLLGGGDAGAEADGVAVLAERVPMIAAASLGDTVVVLANELDKLMVELDEPESDDEELLLLLLPLLLPLLRTRVETTSM